MATMHIELCGYPGAGKTTVAQVLHRERGIGLPKLVSTRSAVFSAPHVAACTLAKPDILGSAVSCGAAGSRGRRRLARVAIRQATTLAGQQEGALLDEGVVHEVWRLLYEFPQWIDRGWWADTLALACPVVIGLDVSLQQAREGIRRKQNPGRINAQLASASPHSGPWQRAQAAMDAVYSTLEGRDEVELIRLDTTGWDVKRVSKEISDRLDASR